MSGSSGTHRGRWGPSDSEGHLGFLITEGLLFYDVELLSTHSAEVLRPGDLLRPWDVDGEDPLPVSTDVSWTVLAPLGVAVLNRDFLARAARFPTVLARVTERGVRADSPAELPESDPAPARRS